VLKAVIIASQRSGSTFLVQCLDSHPQIRCFHEILAGALCSRRDVPEKIDRFRILRKIWQYTASGAWRPAALLDGFYARGEAPVMAFKAMYNHLGDPRTRRYFGHHTEIRVIHLRRDNLLKQYVSKISAQKRFAGGPWSTTRSLSVLSLRISPERAIKEMQRMRDLFQKHEQLFSRHSKIELVYETMIDGQYLSDETTIAIADLLELNPAPMRATSVKANPDKLELLIENYDQVVHELRGTEFERFLD
jgi:hypothetical protein